MKARRLVQLLNRCLVSIQADLYAGAIFINQAFNWNIYAAIVLLLAIAALFTISGSKFSSEGLWASTNFASLYSAPSRYILNSSPNLNTANMNARKDEEMDAVFTTKWESKQGIIST